MATQNWVPGGIFSLPFGASETSIGGPSSHTGQDIQANAGTNIISQVFGIVIGTAKGMGNTYNGGHGTLSYGNEVTLLVTKIGNNPITDPPQLFHVILAHMQDVAVKVGDVVKPGDILGTVGSSGYATGSHLHFEVRGGINTANRSDPGAGTAINPMDILTNPNSTNPSGNPLDIPGAINNFTQTVQNIPATVMADLKPVGIGVGIGILGLGVIIAGILVIVLGRKS